MLSPVGIAVSPTGIIHVTDDSSTPVSMFSPAGFFLASWGTVGPGAGQLLAADGITFDAAGNLFVADGGVASRVAKFSAPGAFLSQWGGYGTGLVQFQIPGDVAVDSNGNVFVTDWMNHRIQVFGPAQPRRARRRGEA